MLLKTAVIQQEKPPGRKSTLAQGLVTCAQAIGRGTSHNLRRVFFFFFFFFFFFLYYVSSARKWTNCAIVPIRPRRPSDLNEDLNRRH